jgi:hypothetical protein
MAHQSADDYRAARKVGDDSRCQQIVAEVSARFNTRTTDGSEIAELYRANLDTPLADPQH